MRKPAIFGFALLLIWLSVSGAAAQELRQGAAWSVTLYDSSTQSFSIVTPGGVQPGPALPAQGFTQLYSVRLSPNGTYAVFSATTSDIDPGGVYVANVSTGSCCVKLQEPSQPNLAPTYVGPFSPDGSQIAVSMYDPMSLGTNQPPNSLMIVFDLATGGIVASAPLSAVPSEDAFAAVAAYGEWKADGIRVAPSCWGCEGVWEGLYSIWDPASGSVSAPVEPFDIFMQKLPTTGEMFKVIANNAYPLSGAPSAYFPAANVVEYYTDSNQTSGQVIYFNPANPYITAASWVYDGRAILVKLGGPATSLADNPFVNEEPGEAVLLFRDGRQVPTQPDLGNVITGTPDGWISQKWDTGEAWMVTVDDGGNTQVTPLGTSTQSTQSQWGLASTSFTLGASAIPSAFPAVSPPARTTCPGFVESRLWPNTYARVTPGDANNLRAEPSTTSALLGTIAAEDFLAVIEGPICTENMAWWKVQYKGQIGWTSEGQGSTYWLEPLSNVM